MAGLENYTRAGEAGSQTAGGRHGQTRCAYPGCAAATERPETDGWTWFTDLTPGWERPPPAGYVIQTACSDLDAVVHASETAVSVANRPCRATCGAVGMALAAADRTAFPSTRTLVLRGSRVAVAGSIACARRRLEARSRGSQTALGPDTCRRYRKIPSSAAPSE